MNQLLTQGYFIKEDGTKSQNKPEKSESRANSADRKTPEKATNATAAKIGSKRSKDHAEQPASKKLKK